MPVIEEEPYIVDDERLAAGMSFCPITKTECRADCMMLLTIFSLSMGHRSVIGHRCGFLTMPVTSRIYGCD